MSALGRRLLAIHDVLDRGGYRHAVGGAIALAYCTAEPRGTRDLDINVFVTPDLADGVLDTLPEEVKVTAADRAAVRRDGQVRLWWDDTPVDLFFNTHDFHDQTAEHLRNVPFEGRMIPVLSCAALLVFKALFGRPRDWADIAEMLAADQGAGHDARVSLKDLVPPDDPAIRRLEDLL